MKQTGISRRDMLKLMSVGVGGFALSGWLPQTSVLAQDSAAASAYADDIALSMDEIARIRATPLRFAFNIDQTLTDYSQLIASTARRVAADYGITLDVNDAANSSSVQSGAMTSQVRLTYDGIFTMAVDADALSDVVEQANQAHIPVVMTGGSPSRGQLFALVNSTNYLGCYQAATALTQAVGGAGKIAVVSSGQDLNAYREGERGVLQAIAESRMQLVDLVAVLDEEAAEQAVTALLAANPDLTAIFSTWSEALDGALSAVAEARSAASLAGFGAEVDTFNAFAASNANLIAVAGERAAVIGRAAIDVLCKAVLGQPVAAEVLVPTLMVDATNFRDRWEEVYPGRRASWGDVTVTATAEAS